MVGAFVLVIVVGALGSKLVLSGGAAAGFGPFLVGSLVWGIGLSLGATTGYAINPARDFGPAPGACIAAHPREGWLRLGL